MFFVYLVGLYLNIGRIVLLGCVIIGGGLCFFYKFLNDEGIEFCFFVSI